MNSISPEDPIACWTTAVKSSTVVAAVSAPWNACMSGRPMVAVNRLTTSANGLVETRLCLRSWTSIVGTVGSRFRQAMVA